MVGKMSFRAMLLVITGPVPDPAAAQETSTLRGLTAHYQWLVYIIYKQITLSIQNQYAT